ncbi:hypothetical protein ADUPG1_000731, partial [Aduncisulcus paluster]
MSYYVLADRISSLESQIATERQAAATERLSLERAIKSLQRELSCVSARVDGGTPTISPSLQSSYDSTVVQRNAVLSRVDKYIDSSISDVSKCTSSLLVSSIPRSLWHVQSNGSDSSTVLVLRALSFLRFLDDCPLVASSSSSSSSSFSSVPPMMCNLHECIRVMTRDLCSVSSKPSAASTSLDQVEPFPCKLSPHFIISECKSPIPDIPCLSTLNKRIQYLESIASRVCSSLTPTNVSCIITTGQHCISQLALLLSHAVGIVDSECISSCDTTAPGGCKCPVPPASCSSATSLLSACDNVSALLSKCLNSFASSARRFTDRVEQYETASDHSCVSFSDLAVCSDCTVDSGGEKDDNKNNTDTCTDIPSWSAKLLLGS